MTDSSFTKSIFPKQFAALERKRQSAVARPLTSQEVTTLQSMRWKGELIFGSIENFYSTEYKTALQSSLGILELEGIPRYRPATAEEANLLYCDLHSRTEKFEYSGGAPSE